MIRLVYISTLILIVILSNLVPQSNAEVTKREPHGTVIDLTADNFDDEMNDPLNGLWLIKFYAPWCGHCKKLAPVLDKVAVYLKGTMAIGKVDCTSHKPLCKKYEVKGYPTMKFYRDGTMFDYPAERHADAIIGFAEKMSGSPVLLIDSYDSALEDVAGKSKDGIAFVAYDPDGEGSGVEGMIQSTTVLQVFGQIARREQASAYFGLLDQSTGKENVLKFGVGDEAFIIKIEAGERPVKYSLDSETLSSPTFLDFVKEQNRALVTSLGAHNFRSLGNMGKPLAIGVIDPDDDTKTPAFQSQLKDFVRNNVDIPSKYIFCWMDGKKWERFLAQFEIGGDSLPELFVLDVPNREFWQDPNSTDVEEFMVAVKSGKIQKRKQKSSGGKGPFQEFKMIFEKNMPWSVIMALLLIVIPYFIYKMGAEDVEEVVVPKKRNTETVKEEETKKGK